MPPSTQKVRWPIIKSEWDERGRNSESKRSSIMAKVSQRQFKINHMLTGMRRQSSSR